MRARCAPCAAWRDEPKGRLRPQIKPVECPAEVRKHSCASNWNAGLTVRVVNYNVCRRWSQQ